MKRLFLAPLMRWAGTLRHPTLFKILAAAFLLDTVIPDFIPFVDEIMLGIATLLVARWKHGNPPGPTDGRR